MWSARRSPITNPPTEKARVEALATLGLPRRATAEQARTAYLDLARELHPDLHPDDAERLARFQQVSAAWELLRRYYRTLQPAARGARASDGYDPLWWKLFGEKV